MLRPAFSFAILLVALAVSCREPRGACVYGGATCRDDGTRAKCDADGTIAGPSAYFAGKTCPALGYACIGDALDAAFRKTNPDGTCPPGSSKVE